MLEQMAFFSMILHCSKRALNFFIKKLEKQNISTNRLGSCPNMSQYKFKLNHLFWVDKSLA